MACVNLYNGNQYAGFSIRIFILLAVDAYCSALFDLSNIQVTSASLAYIYQSLLLKACR